MQYFHPRIGEPVLHLGQRCRIERILDASRCLVQPDAPDTRPRPANLDELFPVPENIPAKGNPLAEDLSCFSEEQLAEAYRRLEIIRPLILEGMYKEIKQTALAHGINAATIYRWLRSYRESGMLASLVPLYHRRGGPCKARLDKAVEKIVRDVVETYYLSEERHSIAETTLEIQARCVGENLKAPVYVTVRNRTLAITQELTVRARLGNKAARRFAPLRGGLPGVDGPWSIIHIDHVKLDIILVDRTTRLPMGRAWLTLAEDAATRMVMGFHVSLDDPSALAVGLCVAHAMLPKEKWLVAHGVSGDWPVWGKPRVIHVDNAEEFRGKVLARACAEHAIDIYFRRAGRPEDGGRLERLNRTINQELHKLPGSTFSSPAERGEYDSEAKAALTLDELERYLAEFIVNIYHQRAHRGLRGKTPLQAWNDGLLGSVNSLGLGLPTRHVDETALRLSFLPYTERTVQTYGLALNEVTYWHDHLRHWIGSKDPHRVKLKRKFRVHYDPRDLSRVWFFDPSLNEHIEVHYRDLTRPPISLWELAATRKALSKQGVKNPNEEMIFSTRERLRAIAAQGVISTKAARRQRERAERRQESAAKNRPAQSSSVPPSTGAPPTSSKPRRAAKDLAYEDIEN